MGQIIIPIALVFACSLGVMFFLNLRRKKALASFDTETEYRNAELFLNNLYENQLSDIKKQMNTATIDAITQCAFLTNIKNQAAGVTVNAAKSIAWAAIGVKAKYKRAEHACFLVLSNKSLHYLFFEEGTIKQHLVLDELRMQSAKIETVSAIDRVTRLGSSLHTKTLKLGLDIDNRPMEILFYNTIYQTPNGMITGKDFFILQEKCAIVGKHFVEKLKAVYPSLGWSNEPS